MATSVYANPFNEINWHSATVAEVENAIASGGDVNSKIGVFNTPVIHNAVYSNSSEIITRLVQAGADINEKDSDGKTSLMRAVANIPVDLPLVSFLLENGADIQAKDNDGNNVLFWAISMNPDNRELINLLLDKGVNVNVKNNQNQFVLSLAKDKSEIIGTELYQKMRTKASSETIEALDKPFLHLSPQMESFYNEFLNKQVPKMTKDILRKMWEDYDSERLSKGVKEIQQSVDMIQLKQNTWECLSQLPEEKWEYKAEEQCFENFIKDLIEKTLVYSETGRVDGGKPSTDVLATISAYYVLDEAVMMSIMAYVKNDEVSDVRDIPEKMSPAFLYGSEKQMPCSAQFYAQRNSDIVVKFSEMCSGYKLGGLYEINDVPADDVIQIMQKRAPHIVRCSGRSCVMNFLR